MPDVLEKVRCLVALAGSPGTSEEEARTAAVQACRIIVAQDLVVAEKTPAFAASTGTSGQAAPAAYDPKDVFQRAARGEVDRPFVRAPARKAGPLEGESRVARVFAKAGSICRNCGGPYLKGEDVYVAKGRHAGVHARCWQGASLPSPTAAESTQKSWPWGVKKTSKVSGK